MGRWILRNGRIMPFRELADAYNKDPIKYWLRGFMEDIPISGTLNYMGDLKNGIFRGKCPKGAVLC